MHKPEPLCDLMAQWADLCDPAHRRAAMVVTDGYSRFVPLWHCPSGVLPTQRNGIVTYRNRAKLERSSMSPQTETEFAKLLDYTVSKDNVVGEAHVVQARRGDAVVWEQVTDDAHRAATLKRAALYGDVLELPFWSVMERRSRLLKAEAADA